MFFVLSVHIKLN